MTTAHGNELPVATDLPEPEPFRFSRGVRLRLSIYSLFLRLSNRRRTWVLAAQTQAAQLWTIRRLQYYTIFFLFTNLVLKKKKRIHNDFITVVFTILLWFILL